LPINLSDEVNQHMPPQNFTQGWKHTFSEMPLFCFLEHKMMDKGQEPNNLIDIKGKKYATMASPC